MVKIKTKVKAKEFKKNSSNRLVKQEVMHLFHWKAAGNNDVLSPD